MANSDSFENILMVSVYQLCPVSISDKSCDCYVTALSLVAISRRFDLGLHSNIITTRHLFQHRIVKISLFLIIHPVWSKIFFYLYCDWKKAYCNNATLEFGGGGGEEGIFACSLSYYRSYRLELHRLQSVLLLTVTHFWIPNWLFLQWICIK